MIFPFEYKGIPGQLKLGFWGSRKLFLNGKELKATHGKLRATWTADDGQKIQLENPLWVFPTLIIGNEKIKLVHLKIHEKILIGLPLFLLMFWASNHLFRNPYPNIPFSIPE